MEYTGLSLTWSETLWNGFPATRHIWNKPFSHYNAYLTVVIVLHVEFADTVQSLCNAIFGVHKNGPCYQQIML